MRGLTTRGVGGDGLAVLEVKIGLAETRKIFGHNARILGRFAKISSPALLSLLLQL